MAIESFTRSEAIAVEALLEEHLARTAVALKNATSEVQCALDCLGDSIRRWQPFADREHPDHRPHQIAIGLLLLRAKNLFAQTASN